MNGLLLPSGSKAPIRGDASSCGPISPPVTAKIDCKTEAQQISPSRTRKPLSAHRSPVASSSSAASLAFIPQSTRSTAGLRKPIHQCSEFELEQMLDRNERILATLQHSQAPTKIRLTRETETLRDAIRSLRAVREMDSGISAVQLSNPSDQDELESALDSLSVNEKSPIYGITPPTESFGWTRDTLAVKKMLAQNSATFQPGRKVQAMSYEQSLSIQTAALVAEMERDRKAEEHRLKAIAIVRDRSSLGVPAGAAHRQGRKSISSCSGSMRKLSTSLSTSPGKESRAAGILAPQAEQAPEPHQDAQLEGGESDQDNAADLYAQDNYGGEDEDDDFGGQLDLG